MSSLVRTGIKTYHCINNVQCNGIIQPAFQNQLNESLRAIANTGETVADINGGLVHGELCPAVGWKRGKNVLSGSGFYDSIHPVEITSLHNKWVLFARCLLGDNNGHSMNWISFRMGHPGTALGWFAEILHGPGSGSAYQIANVPYNQWVDLLMVGDINPSFIPPAGQAWKLNFNINIQTNGPLGAWDINSPYLAGCYFAKLKFFHQCP